MTDISVYLINLDGSNDRLSSARAQLDATGLEFRRVAAFDGRGLRLEQFPDYDHRGALNFMGRPLRGGEIGCYLSHLECARQFLDNGATVGLVLEDDLQLLPGFSEGLSQVVANLDRLRPGWEIVNLGANRHKIYTPILDFVVAGRDHQLTVAHYFPMTTTAILWSRRGAAAFVAEHDRIFASVDNFFRYRMTRSDTGLAVWPPLVVTTGVDSDISPQQGARRSADGRRPLYGLIKQRRLMLDKLIAWKSRRRARAAAGSG